MKKLLATNSFIIGTVYALLIPVLFFGIFYLLKDAGFALHLFNKPKSPYLLSLVPNLVLLRFLFVKFKFEKAGRGMLILTFAEFLAVFIFI